jgi:glycosyltransferase involved in cell wall biosynthesis
MTFVLNARFLAGPTTGVARVGRELLKALLAELAELPASQRIALEIATPTGVEVDGAAKAGVKLVRGVSDALMEQLILPWVRPGATMVNFANATPLLAARSIVWIHDAHVFEAPDAYSAPYRLWHKTMLRACVLRGFRIVTVSNYSRAALIKHGADPARIEVIYNGGDHILRETPDASIAESHGLTPGGFILLVGSRAKHKNLPFAIDALAKSLPPETKIAVVGLHQRGEYTGDPLILNDPRVVRLPMITDGHLRFLYENARCVVIPSVLEGFSLPAVEAMWCGAPLVLANRTALPEVGGPAALFFEPSDGDGLIEAVTLAAGERRAELAAHARLQREKFRWRNAARLLIARHLH